MDLCNERQMKTMGYTYILLLLERGERAELEERLRVTMENAALIIDRLRGLNILERDFQCNFRALYDVSMMGIKGTVSRDFLLQVFFMNHLSPSP